MSNKPVKATMWFTLASIFQKGCALIMIPVYVRLMSTTQYGSYTLFQSWSGIVSIFTTLNIAAYVFNNCLIKDEKNTNRVTSIFMGLLLVLTALWLVVFTMFSDFWTNVFGMNFAYIVLIVLDGAFFVGIDLWYAKERFDYKYKGVVVISVITAISNLVIGIIAVLSSEDKAFAAVLSKVIIQGAIVLFLFISSLKKSCVIFDKEIWKYVITFNIPLIPHFLSTRILQQADRIMIEKICGLEAAGIYGFAYKISDAMIIFNTAILSTVIPWTYKKLKNEEFNQISQRVNMTIILVGVLNLLLVLVTPEVVNIIGTQEYAEAINIMPYVSLSCFMMYVFNVFVNVTYYYEYNNLVVFASIGAAIVNILLNAIFIPRYGMNAAALTTLFSYVLLAITHGLMSRYVLNRKGITDKVYDYKKIFYICASVILIGLLLIRLYSNFFLRVVILLAIGIVAFLKRKDILGYIR